MLMMLNFHKGLTYISHESYESALLELVNPLIRDN